MIYEIGSHFEFDKTMKFQDNKSADWLPNLGDFAFTFSGRAAIELVLENISHTRKVRSVYMPSYCCDSMVDPFIKKGVDVQYYDVSYSKASGLKYDIELDNECDIFFAMSYFGLEDFNMDAAVEAFVKEGKVIIEDITHRLLSEQPNSHRADYCIASLRKWFAIPTGGYVTKRREPLLKKPYLNSDHLVTGKIDAMYEKKRYLHGLNNNKESFLDKFKNFDEKIGYIDCSYHIDSLSLDLIKQLDLENIKKRRRENAKVLYEGLVELGMIETLIPAPNLNDKTPLFVPVMLTNEKRNALRKELIENKIYCPVHWPRKNNTDNIWKNELSIICDQRYNEKDMENIIEVIEKWYNRNIE